MQLGLSLALTRIVGGGGGGAPAIDMDPVPALLEGTVGNSATFPHFAKLLGPNEHLYSIGPVLMDGSQITRVYTASTAVISDSNTDRSGDAADDHNNDAQAAWLDGTLETFASGHNSGDSTVERSIRSPEGVWSAASSLSFPLETTYPTPIMDTANDTLRFIIRCANTDWYMRTKVGSGGAYSAAVNWLTASDQCYCLPRYDPVGERILFSIRFNNSLPVNGGQLRFVEFDCNTEEFRDINGGLGFLDGSPSAGTGKTLPIVLDDVPAFQSPAAGRLLYCLDHTADTLLIVNSENSVGDLFDSNLSIYTYNGSGDRLDLTNWTQHPSFTAMNWKMGTIFYLMGGCIASETHTGIRLYLCRSVAARYTLEQWDCPTGDGETWTMKRLAVTPDASTVMFRCITAANATETMPVAVGQFDSFGDYDTYTGAKALFAEPWRGTTWPVIAPGYTMRTETQAWLARMGVQPNDYWAKFVYDPMIDTLVDAGVWTKLDFLYLWLAHDREASLLNAVQNAYNATQAGSLPNAAFTVGQGWRGTGTTSQMIDLNFNPSTSVGRKMGRDDLTIGVLFGGTGVVGSSDITRADVTDFGSDTHRILAFGQAVAATSWRASQSATTNGASLSTRKGQGLRLMTRNNSANFIGQSDNNEVTYTQASAAPANANLMALGRSGSTAASTRSIYAIIGGQALDATERAAVCTAFANYQNAVMEYLGVQV